MHFAAHMTTTNLTSQNIEVPVKPNVSSRDGVEAMIQSPGVNDDPPAEEQPLTRWLETMVGVPLPRDFDIVIMNPPFTRRERIPAKKEDLQKLVPEVKGKTGYWAYFVVPADGVLKKDGVLAIVIPEEFFVGGGAESVRRLVLLDKNYGIKYVVRSAEEVAFSESALYRDYLVVFKKGEKSRQLIVAVLKKKLSDLHDKIDDVAIKIKDFASSLERKVSLEELDAIKFFNADDLITRHISNLKPLVGFNTIEAQMLALELLGRLKDMPTIGELDESELIKMRLYRPGQYRTKGVESYAQKLFTSKYGARSPNVMFLIDKTEEDMIKLRLKRRPRTHFDLPLEAAIRSLRTYSGVGHINITGEEEFAIVDLKIIPEYVLNLLGLIPFDKALRASQDIKKAYDDLAGDILLTRRIQLSSPQAYWIAFYSDNKVLGSQLPGIRVKDVTHGKLLALYLNSTITLLQLVSFVAESRGAWVSLDHARVWSHIHVPDIKNLSDEKVEKALNIFAKVSKLDAKPLLQRIKEHDKLQKSIDEIALEMVDLDDWKSRLDELYEAVAGELEAMHRILETSRRTVRRKERRKVSEEVTEKTLDRWLKALD